MEREVRNDSESVMSALKQPGEKSAFSTQMYTRTHELMRGAHTYMNLPRHERMFEHSRMSL